MKIIRHTVFLYLKIFQIQFFNLNSHHTTTFCCRSDFYLIHYMNFSLVIKIIIHSFGIMHYIYVRLKRLMFSGWFSFRYRYMAYIIIHYYTAHYKSLSCEWMNECSNQHKIYISTFVLIILKIGRIHRVSIYMGDSIDRFWRHDHFNDTHITFKTLWMLKVVLTWRARTNLHIMV